MLRGDGLLNHDLLPDEELPKDQCGVFGVWAPGEEVAKLTFFGLYWIHLAQIPITGANSWP